MSDKCLTQSPTDKFIMLCIRVKSTSPLTNQQQAGEIVTSIDHVDRFIHPLIDS